MASVVRTNTRAVALEENMTQLNLSGKQSNNPKKNPITDPEGGSITNQTVGALGALAMFAAVIVVGSCSRGNKPVAVQQSMQPEAPVVAAAVPTPPPVAVPVKAKVKTRRAATLSYVNREYGVAFDFPRQYKLESADKAQLSWGDLGPFEMDFVHPGGVTIAAVTMPEKSYPGTDLKSAFVNVSVNPEMSAEECSQFAPPQSAATGDSASAETTKNLKIGKVEFTEVEKSDAGMMKQADARYYHAFNNGACYEFALGVGTSGDGSAETKPVDRAAVFGKLEKILASVKLQPAVIPQTRSAAPPAKEASPDATASMQEEDCD